MSCYQKFRSKSLEDKEFLIKEIKRWRKNHNGKTPTRDEMKVSEGYPSASTYRKVFEKWSNVLKAEKEHDSE